MADLEPILAALDYVEEHLRQDITVADMAEAAAYSLFHFSRVFNQAIHHTPYDYLMRRRLSESARELVESDRKVIDVAFDYGFKNPETFSRAFRRMFGMQPMQWRKRGDLDRRYLFSAPTREHVEHINSGDPPSPVVEERPATHLAGLMNHISAGDAATVWLWDLLNDEFAGEPRVFYAVTWYPPGWGKRGVFYMAAVEIAAGVEPTPVLARRCLPAQRYARFVHKGPRDAMRLTRDYIYQTWLPQSDYRLSHAIEVERYGSDPRHLRGTNAPIDILLPVEQF